MLTTLFKGLGGIIRDTQEVITTTSEVIYDEVTSIPEAFTEGYNEGLITTNTEETKETETENKTDSK